MTHSWRFDSDHCVNCGMVIGFFPEPPTCDVFKRMDLADAFKLQAEQYAAAQKAADDDLAQ